MKLYVGNLPFGVDEDALRELFAGFDPEEVSLIKDKFSGRSKGFGFVTISSDEAAQRAISEMNGKDVQGRELKVSEAKPMEDRPERPRRSFGGGGRSGGFHSGGGRDGGRSGGYGGGQRRDRF
ncbi:MAG TPA: RNA-binding protein [Patescibacteria group bacterium]|nr:RNA-binding protein [Patescibacteria group bacterium]